MKIFQINSPLVREKLRNSDNIRIIEDNETTSDLCVVYFSSNELYYPNTETAFTNSIIKRDKFEWINNKLPGTKRHIFVRDIKKQWYIEGVSDQIDSPELLSQKLLELSKGMRVFTVGSSAGGFAALYFGTVMKVERVYAFNAQLNLLTIMKQSDAVRDPLLFKHRNDERKHGFYDSSHWLASDIDYFYFQSAKSKMDIEQFESCNRNSLLIKIEFDTDNHGFPFLRHDLGHVLSLSKEQLKKLSTRRIHPFIFSTKIHGIARACWLTFDKLKNRAIKKVREKIES